MNQQPSLSNYKVIISVRKLGALGVFAPQDFFVIAQDRIEAEWLAMFQAELAGLEMEHCSSAVQLPAVQLTPQGD